MKNTLVFHQVPGNQSLLSVGSLKVFHPVFEGSWQPYYLKLYASSKELLPQYHIHIFNYGLDGSV